MIFHVVSRGDITTGEGSHYARIEINDEIESPEFVQLVREQLSKSFAVLFDNPKPQILTEDEFIALTGSDD